MQLRTPASLGEPRCLSSAVFHFQQNVRTALTKASKGLSRSECHKCRWTFLNSSRHFLHLGHRWGQRTQRRRRQVTRRFPRSSSEVALCTFRPHTNKGEHFGPAYCRCLPALCRPSSNSSASDSLWATFQRGCRVSAGAEGHAAVCRPQSFV